MRNSDYYINITEYMKELLINWKKVVLCGVIGSLLVLSASFLWQSNNEKNNNIADYNLEAVVSRLDEDEIEQVEDVVGLLKMYDSYEKYRDHAIAMKIDPYECRELYMTYYITGGETESGEVDGVTRYIRSDEFLEKLAEQLYPAESDISALHMEEVVLVDKGGANATTTTITTTITTTTTIPLIGSSRFFTITMLVPDDINMDDAAGLIDKLIQEESTAELTDTWLRTGRSDKILGIRNTIEAQNSVIMNWIKTEIAELSDDQYVFLKYQIDDNESYKQTASAYMTRNVEGVGSINGARRAIGKKTCIIGFIAGVLLCIIWDMSMYMLFPIAGSVIGYGALEKTRKLGCYVNTDDKHNIIRSRFWENKFYGRKCKKADRTASIVDGMAFYGAEQKDFSFICAGDGADGVFGEAIKTLSEKLEEKGYEIKNVFYANNKEYYKQQAYSDMKSLAGNVIVFTNHKCSSFYHIDHICDFIESALGMNILGYVEVR